MKHIYTQNRTHADIIGRYVNEYYLIYMLILVTVYRIHVKTILLHALSTTYMLSLITECRTVMEIFTSCTIVDLNVILGTEYRTGISRCFIEDTCADFTFTSAFNNSIVAMGFLPWEIRVAFPEESQLR